MPELEHPYADTPLVRDHSSLNTLDRFEQRELPHVETTPDPTGLCLWLTASRPEALREVAEALSSRLGPDPSRVEILGVESLVAKGLPAGSSGRSAVVTTLARAAAALVRRGVTVVVAYPLNAQERSSARELVGRMVEIYVRTSPKEIAPDHIPVIYRTLENGEVRERELTPHFEPPGRPDVILEGSARGATETALDIVDALARAGWFAVTDRARPALVASPP
jgi:adenylylsulfate kinase-like enzyme